MTDIVKEAAREKVFNNGGYCATLQEYYDRGEDEDAKLVIKGWTESYEADVLHFLKHLRDNGPDKEMKGKPNLFGGFYWGTIKSFLNHVIRRLEETNND